MARVLTRPHGKASHEAPPPHPRDHREGGGGGEWALLTVARNHVVAHLIRGRLAQEGIYVVLDASNASPGAWLHPFGDPASPVKVFVRRTDLSAASLLLHEVDQPSGTGQARPGSSGSGSVGGRAAGRPGAGSASLAGPRVGPGALRMVFRVLAAIAAALALSGLLLFGPCVSHWFCV